MNEVGDLEESLWRLPSRRTLLPGLPRERLVVLQPLRIEAELLAGALPACHRSADSEEHGLAPRRLL
eukprot:4097852-Prymnesium_polylepis.1